MNQDKFNSIISRVTMSWPGKVPAAVVAEVYRAMQGYSEDEFEQVAQYVLKNNQYAPKLKNFTDAASALGIRRKIVPSTQADSVATAPVSEFHMRDDIYYSRHYIWVKSQGRTFLRELASEGQPIALELEVREHEKTRPAPVSAFNHYWEKTKGRGGNLSVAL